MKRLDTYKIFESKVDKSDVVSYTKYGRLDKLKDVINGGFDIHTTFRSKTLLHYALENDKYDIADYLIENGLNVDRRNNNGKNMLDIFVRNDKSKQVDYLLKKGSNPFNRDHNDFTPIETAFYYNNLNIVKIFIVNGVNIFSEKLKIYKTTTKILRWFCTESFQLLLSENCPESLIDLYKAFKKMKYRYDTESIDFKNSVNSYLLNLKIHDEIRDKFDYLFDSSELGLI